MKTRFDMPENTDVAWCPGCGNFSLLKMIKETLEEMDLDPENVFFSSGIGQAAKMPQYIRSHFFNGLHGRALPVATAVKSAHPHLHVFAEGGDGDMYGEGGNHFIHTIRRNPDIVHLVHNNQIYGLTKGQASPTTARNQKTTLQLTGVSVEPLNPIALAISQKASFVARTFSGNIAESKKILREAVQHKGYALIDMLHPCVSFNKVNDFKWYKNHTYLLEEGYDPEDFNAAMEVAMNQEQLAIGIIYRNRNHPVLTDGYKGYRGDKEPLYKTQVDPKRVIKRLFLTY